MSSNSTSDSKPTTKTTASAENSQEPAVVAPKPSTQLEEDDEFEDFPVEDWGDEDTEPAATSGNSHLWEESWDDDDTSEEFAAMLKEELKKVEDSKK